MLRHGAARWVAPHRPPAPSAAGPRRPTARPAPSRAPPPGGSPGPVRRRARGLPPAGRSRGAPIRRRPSAGRSRPGSSCRVRHSPSPARAARPRRRAPSRPAGRPARARFLDRRRAACPPWRRAGAELAEHEAEHLLVAAALDQAVQRARHHPAGAGPASDARHDAGDRRRARPSSTVARMRGSIAASAVAAGRAEAGSARKRCRMPGRSSRQSTPATSALGEHVGGDEAAERGAETLLLAPG